MSGTHQKQSHLPKAEVSSHEPKPTQARPASQPEHPLPNLQRTIGNQAVLRMMRAQSGYSETFQAQNARNTCQGLSAVLQPKLAVNAPGDSFEQEADRVSEQVMRMPRAWRS